MRWPVMTSRCMFAPLAIPKHSGDPHYPSGFDLENIISVAATDQQRLICRVSAIGADTGGFGRDQGVDILSTLPKGSCAIVRSVGLWPARAALPWRRPHVTGAVALIASKYTDFGPLQIKQRIMTGVDALADMSKPTVTNGRLNVLNTLEDDTQPPAAVASLAVDRSVVDPSQVELDGDRRRWHEGDGQCI